ncbi:class I SAM-dependent methyltransferase [Pelotomaculum propionicicum]|uniref:class I SAM-dependent methyltransferase n=1 Tax=Pelotomaculum propionicicum TaxID=258475 RepID=UPI003B7C6EB5
MEDILEILLYIAYNLENQDQAVTVDAIRRQLEWMQGQGFVIEESIERLAMDGFLTSQGENEFKLTKMGRNESFKINKIRAKDDYNRLMDRSTDSAAYLDYCEEIYGYRMYLFNMMDKSQLDYLFSSVAVLKSDTVLDLGCGPGSILDCLASKYGCHGIGIDQIEHSIVKKCGKVISYINGDIDMLASYDLKPSITLSIDSLYFSNDLDGLIRQLKSIENNRLYLYSSQYIFDETRKNEISLHRDNTRIARVLRQNGMLYKTVDYSENEHSLYENAVKALPKYKNDFEREGNIDLYEAKLREGKSGKELYEKGLARRYLYIVE